MQPRNRRVAKPPRGGVSTLPVEGSLVRPTQPRNFRVAKFSSNGIQGLERRSLASKMRLASCTSVGASACCPFFHDACRAALSLNHTHAMLELRHGATAQLDVHERVCRMILILTCCASPSPQHKHACACDLPFFCYAKHSACVPGIPRIVAQSPAQPHNTRM